MKVLTLILLILGTHSAAQAQGTTCAAAEPFCVYEGVTYPATTNSPAAPFGNQYGCLFTQPNPAWFYIEMDVAGGLSIQLTNSNNVDVDFALWGPYPDLATALSNCGSLPAPVSCSYSPNANETIQIPANSQVGNIFILMITNFSNQPTEITANAVAGNGNTSCDDVCIAAGGMLNSPDLFICETDVSVSLPPTDANMTPDYGYTYIIADANTGSIIDQTPDLSTLGIGSYTVCGFSYNLLDAGMLGGLIGQSLSTVQGQFAGNMDPFCGDFSDDCVNVTVDMTLTPIVVDTTLCPGDCFDIGGMNVCNTTTFFVPTGNGCDQEYNITVTTDFIPPTDVEFEKCPNDCVLYEGMSYCTAGSYQVDLTSFNGCDSTILLEITDIVTTAIISPNPPPDLDCNNPSVILTSSTSTPSGGPYEWNGPNGFTSSDENIIVTEPGDYTLTVFNNASTPPCEDMVTVTVNSSPNNPDLQVIEDPMICDGESVDLDAFVIDANGNSTITFHSNTPPNGGNQISSTVMPTVTTTYYVLATDGGCTDEAEITVFVNDSPTADFIVDSPICLTDESIVTYTGNAGSGAIYNWDFSAGSASPGSGQGPHNVSFPAEGIYTVTLTVEENGCTSTLESMDIEVVAPLDPPMIQCQVVTPTSVQFFWNPVAGANGYDVQVLTGQPGSMNGPTTFLVDGISSNEDVTITVIAFGDGTCGDSETTFTCTSAPCAAVNIDITPVDPICLDGMGTPFDLQVSVSGGVGGGTGNWIGTAITNPVTGTVDPSLLNPGDNTFTYEYTEGDCEYMEDFIIVGSEVPTADFSATSPLCVTGSSTVTYEGTAANNANYIWNFDGGTATPGNGQGPHTVTWTSGGLKTITLTVEENGCFSEPFEVIVDVLEQLQPPVINCNPTTSSIEFTWSDVVGADSYNVIVVSGPTGSMTGPNSYEVTGLMPNETVTITVEAIGNAPCPPSSATETCSAQDCDPIVVMIDPVADICLDGTQGIVTLNATTDDATPTGVFEFGGSPAVTLSGDFDPDLANIGANTITVTYIEGTCTYNGDITINVIAQPTSDFTVDSPICEIDISVVNYTGNASSNAIYTWDFGGGSATPGTGAGPHQVSWGTAGTYTVTLMVEENGCMSTMTSETVQVDAALVTPDIDCNATLNSVEFIWDSVDGATGYTVNVLSGQTGSPSSDTSFLFTGLGMMETVNIELVVETNSTCGNITVPANCETSNCPQGDIDITNPGPICLDNNTGPITLEFTVTGIQTDTVCWSGSCIPNPKDPIFDPNMAQPGGNEVTVTIINGSCTYTETILIEIIEQPTADFTVTSPICLNESSIVTYTGSAPPGSIFTWDFGGGTAVPGTGQGPHEVSWGAAGQQSITLMVTDNNGCASEINTQMVQVDEPLTAPDIDCNATINSVEFTWDAVAGATGYTVNVLSGQTGMMTSDTSFIFTGLGMMETVNIELVVETNSACGNITVPAMCETTNCPQGDIDIINPGPICLDNNTGPITLQFTVTGIQTDTVCWSGSCIPNPKDPIFDPNMAQPGGNEVTVTIINSSCTYTESIVIEVIEQPTADFTASSPICENATSTVTYTGNAPAGSTFTWDFGGGTAVPGTGAGPHEVSWGTAGQQSITLMVTDGNGCASEVNTQMVQVDAELIAPDIDCNATLNSVEFTWDAVAGATGYTVNVLSGQTGMMNSDTSFIFENLGTMEVVNIELVVETNSACGNITVPATCETTDCPPGDITIVNPGPICLDDNAGPITLQFTVTGIQTDSVCWSGSCIPNPKDPIFDPNMAQPGLNDVTVTIINGDCTYTESIAIEVITPPTADFTATSPICIDATSTVTYTGNAPAGSTFTWDFGGGTAVPGTGAGPHEVSWGTTGPQTIALMVTDGDGCASEIFMVDVQVDDLLALPVINCSSTTTSVEFFWDPIVGATDYMVDILTGQTGMMTSDTSFEITGLATGTMVEISVTANGNTVCGPSTATGECTALDCPTVTIDITPVGDICLAGANVPVSLEVMVDGNPNCVGEWSGDGIIDATNGVFDPIVAGVGAHVITYTCTDGPCINTQTTTINVFAVPTADFTFTTPICEDDASTIEYSGTASANATFTWNFGGGIANPGGNSPGPHLVTWASGGTQTVTLTVEENGCVSDMISNDIEVESPLIAPLIDCNTTTESIEFIWNTVAGASGYNVTVLAGQTGTQTSDTTYLVTGLDPLDMVTISVEVVDDGPCDNITVETTCTAVDCPDVTIAIEPIGPYCFGGLLEQEILDVTVTGGNGGTGIWSGDGIVNPNDDIFDPIVAGVGTHQLIYTYTEGNCSYNESIVVEIIAAPTADAGLAQTLTCDEPTNVAQLGGNGTSVGANITYDWDTATGIPFPGDSTIANPIVAVPGVYTLTVTNTALGCSAISTVSVDANQSIPTPMISASDATCFGEGDGFLAVDTVINGTPPYLYSFNGGPLSSTSFFPNLEAGPYSLYIEDASGCSQELTFEVGQPDELTLTLNTSIENSDNIIELGDGVVLSIQSSIDFEELDSVQWLPPSSVLCDTCEINTVFPTAPTTYTVMVQEGDCMATDQVTIFVSKDLDIFVPNVFSPNGDGENEFVFPQAKEEVVLIINSFLIFNRWGEAVYEIYNLPPNDISLGWDGTQRGKPLDPQVFVWFAEVVFVDGTTKIFKGDVTLIK